MALESGTRLGPYEVLALVGAGESGDIYKATDTRLNRTVALRTLPPQWADDPETSVRFQREAQIIAGLSHPNICALHDVNEPVISHEPTATSPEPSALNPESIRFLVTEYLEGETLAKRLERGPLPLHAAVKIAIDLTDALDKAHQLGIVHRDLKPSNIFLARQATDAPRDGRKRRKDEDVSVKLMDFGVAKSQTPAQSSSVSMRSTRAHVLAPDVPMSALQYMAPEQLEGDEADARTDIFSFGAIFYEMVTGTKAFEGKNRPMLIAAVASLDLDPLSKAQPAVPPALDHVAERCVEKDPDDRWQTAHDLNLQLRWIAERRRRAVRGQSRHGPSGRRGAGCRAARDGRYGDACAALFSSPRRSGRVSVPHPRVRPEPVGHCRLAKRRDPRARRAPRPSGGRCFICASGRRDRFPPSGGHRRCRAAVLVGR